MFSAERPELDMKFALSHKIPLKLCDVVRRIILNLRSVRRIKNYIRAQRTGGERAGSNHVVQPIEPRHRFTKSRRRNFRNLELQFGSCGKLRNSQSSALEDSYPSAGYIAAVIRCGL